MPEFATCLLVQSAVVFPRTYARGLYELFTSESYARCGDLAAQRNAMTINAHRSG